MLGVSVRCLPPIVAENDRIALELLAAARLTRRRISKGIIKAAETMTRNNSEYKAAVRRVQEHEKRLAQQAVELENTGLTKDRIKRVTDPVRSFQDQLKEEIESYERLKRGEFDEFQNLSGFGELLIALRIAKGVTQRELAKRLGVSESQISRDERNEYHGITLERANRILEALDVEVTTEVSSLGRSRRSASARS